MKKKILGSALIVLIVDQLTKFGIIKTLAYGVRKTIFKNFFALTFVKNTGGAFSLFTDNTTYLIIAGVIILIAILGYLKARPPKGNLEAISYGALIGGLIGNLIDRVARAGVVDFLDVTIFGYNFPIFNMADIAIVLAVITIIFLEIRGDKNADR